MYNDKLIYKVVIWVFKSNQIKFYLKSAMYIWKKRKISKKLFTRLVFWGYVYKKEKETLSVPHKPGDRYRCAIGDRFQIFPTSHNIIYSKLISSNLFSQKWNNMQTSGYKWSLRHLFIKS